MKHVPPTVDDMLFERTDQPEVIELEPEDGWKQWRLATKLNEPAESEWERTMPMDLMP
jgi:hypothetical protein